MSGLKVERSQLAQKLVDLQDAKRLSVLTADEMGDQLHDIRIPENADAVFEGGGVKGIALAGAIDIAEKLGVKWQCLAGTSAGAITACLLAAGYTAEELITIVTREMDFRKFMDEGWIDKIPIIGKIASVLFEKGIYEGNYFKNWLEEKLTAKGIRTFADVKREDGAYRLRLIATDVTRREMLILPDDLKDYDCDPDQFSVARAVRMSMSIPYFFEPVRIRYKDESSKRCLSYIVDGGLLSNFPVWLFDVKSGHTPRWPTYGFKLIEPDSDKPSPSKWPHQYMMSLFTTMLEAHDKAYIDKANFERTVGIPTMGIQTTQFDIDDAEKNMLLRSGQEAAIDFFKTWDFDAHNRQYRHVK